MRETIFRSGDDQPAPVESTVTRSVVLNDRVAQMPDIQPVTGPSWLHNVGSSIGSWAPPVLAAVFGFVGVLIATSYVLDRGLADPGASTEAGSGADAVDPSADGSTDSLQSQVVEDAGRGPGPDDRAGSDQPLAGADATTDTDATAPTPSLAVPSSTTSTTSTSTTQVSTTEQSVTSVTTTVTSVSTTVAPAETTSSSSTTPSSTETSTTPTTASTTTTTSTPPSVTEPAGEQAQQVLALTNAERVKVGCPELTLNGQLNSAADGHSEDMAARDYFDHVDPEGNDAGSRVDASGYQWQRWGENIAVGHPTAADVVQGWMNSDGHRANILNCAFRELGVGHATNAATGNRPYWTQVFGTPR